MFTVSRNSALSKLSGSRVYLIALSLAWCHGAGAQILFSDVSSASGVQYAHDGDVDGPGGGGAAWVDIDNDGDDDLYATQGVGCNPLYQNNGDGTFTPLIDAAGASDCAGVAHGVAAADYDNDGDQDLLVTNNGPNKLFKNMLIETGAVAFTDVTAAAGLGDADFNSASANWGDFDRDGNLDLFINNHLITNTPEFSCGEDGLWHSQGDGTFVNIASQTGVGLSGDIGKAGCPLASAFSDYDHDGDPDLMVIMDLAIPSQNDVPTRLFRNDGPDGMGGWLFTDVSDFASFNWVQAGMGIAVADFDRNGLLDYYVSDLANNELAVNNGDGTFTESAVAFGVEANDSDIWGWFGLVSWGTGFSDLDLDGWQDLVVCHGGAPLDKYPGAFGGLAYTQETPCYVYRSRLAGVGDFQELHTALGVTATGYYRGVAFSDFDNDGDVDMHFSNLQGLNRLYRNNATGLNAFTWLKVKVTGSISNRDGIGAKVWVRTGQDTQLREIDGGSSHLSRNTLTAHFGMQSAQTGDVTVTFPSGITQEQLFVDVDQTLQVDEPLVSAEFLRTTQVAAPGALAAANVRITNHSTQNQTRDLWVSQVSASGETSVGAASSVTLGPGASTLRRVLLSASAQSGVQRYGVRLGTFDTNATHRHHMRLVVPLSE